MGFRKIEAVNVGVVTITTLSCDCGLVSQMEPNSTAFLPPDHLTGSAGYT